MLVGEDEVQKSAVADEFLEMVEEGLRAFNVDRLYGGDARAADLIQAAATLPMMAPRRLVIVLEAEKLFTPKRESKAADEEQERLETFLDDPPPHATVVFVCGQIDMRRRSAKTLVRTAFQINCGTIEDTADAERWVKARAAAIGANLAPGAARALVERAGLDIGRLRAGLDRLALYAIGQPAVTIDDVQQAVPAGPDVQADFGIAKAIWRNDAADALRELGLALEAGAVPVMIMGQLRAAAEKLAAPRLKNAMEAVFRTDLALKSSGGEPRILLERLVVELCEGRLKPAATFRDRGGRL
jgi:DNA polymerase-3 subunit delta